MYLSIIIPMYNVEEYIGDCLASIKNQVGSINYEVIIVDDGSFDGSYQIVEKYCNENSNFKYYYQSNSGQASARNFGISKAEGDYIAFVDADDWISPVFVSSLFEYTIKNNTDLVYFDRIFNDGHKEKIVSYPKYSGSLNKNPSLLVNVNLSACNKIYSRVILDGIKFPIGVIYEDFPFVILAMLRANNISKCEGTLYSVRTRRKGSTTNKLNEDEIDLLANLKCIEKKIEDINILDEFYKFRSITLVGWNFKLIRNRAFHLINNKENKNIKYSHLIKKWDKIGYVFIKLGFYKTLSFLLTLRKKIIR